MKYPTCKELGFRIYGPEQYIGDVIPAAQLEDVLAKAPVRFIEVQPGGRWSEMMDKYQHSFHNAKVLCVYAGSVNQETPEDLLKECANLLSSLNGRVKNNQMDEALNHLEKRIRKALEKK